MKITIIYFVSVSIYLNQSCDNYNYIQALTLAVLNIINPKDIGDSSKAAPFAWLCGDRVGMVSPLTSCNAWPFSNTTLK